MAMTVTMTDFTEVQHAPGCWVPVWGLLWFIPRLVVLGFCMSLPGSAGKVVRGRAADGAEPMELRSATGKRGDGCAGAALIGQMTSLQRIARRARTLLRTGFDAAWLVRPRVVGATVPAYAGCQLRGQGRA